MKQEIIEQSTVGVGNNIGNLQSSRSFRQEMNVTASTVWRWEKRKWLPPAINIGGRKYYRQEQLDDFRRRAAAGEFAASIQPPKSGKQP
jgi:hypothetical protein